MIPEHIGDWALVILMVGVPMYLVLRANVAGLVLGLVTIWLLYSIMCFLGPEPSGRGAMERPNRILMFVIGGLLYFFFWCFVFFVKDAAGTAWTKYRRRKQGLPDENHDA